MSKFSILAVLVAGLLIFAACGDDADDAAAAAQGSAEPVAAREITVLVGAGEDTTSVNAFLPSKAAVRAGDTVTFKLNSDEVHTTHFLSGAARPPVALPIAGGAPNELQIPPAVAFPSRPPGGPVEVYGGTGMISSGVMSNVPAGPPGTPPNNLLTVTFDTPGTYEYFCMLHPPMRASITVLEASEPDAPSQADIDADAKKEEAALRAQIKTFEEAGAKSRSEIGPNGTTFWHVQAGTGGAPATAQSFEFLEKDLNIREGDTVIWTSEMFHNVTFHPGVPAPEFAVPILQEQGPPIISLNPAMVFPQKPAAAFDGTGLWSSGIIGIDTMPLPGGKTFSMTFSKAGTYEYMCAIHRVLGMEGTVTVTERAVTPVAELSVSGGEFPEGLAVDRQGNVYAGMAVTGEIKKITPQGVVSTFAKLPSPGEGFMTGLEFDAKDELYVALAASDAENRGVWRVSANGSNTELFASLPMEVLPNVLDFDSQGNLYVSDTTGGAVLKIDRQGNVSDWKTDPLLMGAVPPTTPLGIPIGANGVNLDQNEDNLYVAVTEFGRIVRIPVNPDGSAGAAEVFVENLENLGFPDGMAFGPSGDLYVASLSGDKVVRVSPDGSLTSLDAGSPLQNPSDVEFGIGDDAGTLYIANFAMLRACESFVGPVEIR